ncbi:hypothetical protein B296_00048409, partial [Ensete ventricosum]
MGTKTTKRRKRDHCVPNVRLVNTHPPNARREALEFVVNAGETTCVRHPTRQQWLGVIAAGRFYDDETKKGTTRWTVEIARLNRGAPGWKLLPNDGLTRRRAEWRAASRLAAGGRLVGVPEAHASTAVMDSAPRCQRRNPGYAPEPARLVAPGTTGPPGAAQAGRLRPVRRCHRGLLPVKMVVGVVMVVVVVMLRARAAVLVQIRRAAYPMHPTAAQVGRALDPMHAATAADGGVGTEGEEGGGAIDGGGGGGEGGGSGRDCEHGAPRAAGCGGVDGVNVALVEGGGGTVAARGRGGGGEGEEEEAEAGGGGEGGGAGVE